MMKYVFGFVCVAATAYCSEANAECGDNMNATQLLLCVDQLSKDIDNLKKERDNRTGVIAFFMKEDCPDGWRVYEALRGRYVVGLNLGGRPGKRIGEQLKDTESRSSGSHLHNYEDSYIGHNCSPSTTGLTTEFYNGSNVKLCIGSKRTTSNTEKPLTPGTNSPYVQLLACQKM